ncbi:MAG: AhpC/TSA family protein [Pseudomonadales bacterium]|nr:AhpC/TSA family protein [Pseudomonadales bacterium]
MADMVDSDLMEKLAQLRATHCARLPTPEMAVLSRATARLRRSGILQRCLQPGETVPNFDFGDADDGPGTLYDLLQQRPVVVKFFRGFWCPFCKTESEAYEDIRGELEALGCHFFAVTPGRIPPGQAHLRVIHDEDNRIARRFGVAYELSADEIDLLVGWGLEVDQVNTSGKWEIPLPATYLVNTDRTVAWQFVDADFRERCCPDELIDEAQQCCCQATPP